jgi:hypothetical protein
MPFRYAVVDLGSLSIGPRAVPRLGCGPGERSGVQVLQVVAGRPLFLRTVDNCAAPGFAWGALTPGRYQLRATEMLEVSTSHGRRQWSWWRPGDPFGDAVEVEVHADGSCTPAVVWPAGIRQ